jgi:hypothetical protein
MTTTLNASTAGAGGFIATSDNSGVLALQTAGTTAITVDASQNVGIGTASPSSTAMLEVSRSTTVIPTATVTADAQVVGWRFRRTGGTYPREYYIGLRENSTAWDFYDNTADALRMRIDSSGNLLVGTTSLIGNGKVNVNFAGGSASSRGVTAYSSSTAGTAMFSCNNSNGIVGEIVSTGSSTSYVTTSDYRLKEDIAPITGALSKVAQLNPVTYKWKVDGSDGQGFIAHELQAIVPDCVTGDKDAIDADGNPVYQGIDTSFLVATLTAAIQELKAINDTQAETINALTARIVALEGQ